MSASRLIVIDFTRTLFDPETNSLFLDAQPFLIALTNPKNILALVSHNEMETQNKLNQFSLIHFFTEIIIGEKTLETFTDLKNKYPNCAAWTIGDRIDGEIKFGNEAGFKTIRLRRGKFAHHIPQDQSEIAQFEVDDLLSALPIIQP